jgi:hypothetical protein
LTQRTLNSFHAYYFLSVQLFGPTATRSPADGWP